MGHFIFYCIERVSWFKDKTNGLFFVILLPQPNIFHWWYSLKLLRISSRKHLWDERILNVNLLTIYLYLYVPVSTLFPVSFSRIFNIQNLTIFYRIPRNCDIVWMHCTFSSGNFYFYFYEENQIYKFCAHSIQVKINENGKLNCFYA